MTVEGEGDATLRAAGLENAKRYDWAKNKEMASAVLGKILGSFASPRSQTGALGKKGPG